MVVGARCAVLLSGTGAGAKRAVVRWPTHSATYAIAQAVERRCTHDLSPPETEVRIRHFVVWYLETTGAGTPGGMTGYAGQHGRLEVDASDRAAACLDACRQLARASDDVRVTSVGGPGGVPLGLTPDELASIRSASAPLNDAWPEPGVAVVIINAIEGVPTVTDG
ncbi:hypothetical protein tb265_00290 [Gemmatimonadetes bacterium T265]|nr:hypothetical protein tb265_00290 [Gemmatimonadetes bacterium T265]